MFKAALSNRLNCIGGLLVKKLSKPSSDQNRVHDPDSAASAIDIASRDMQWIRLFCTSLIIVFNRLRLPQVASLLMQIMIEIHNVRLFVFNGSVTVQVSWSWNVGRGNVLELLERSAMLINPLNGN